MAFSFNGFSPNRATYKSTTAPNAPAIHTYLSDVDQLSIIENAGYFNQIQNSLAVNDLIYAKGVDLSSFLVINNINPVIVAEFP